MQWSSLGLVQLIIFFCIQNTSSVDVSLVEYNFFLLKIKHNLCFESLNNDFPPKIMLFIETKLGTLQFTKVSLKSSGSSISEKIQK